MSSHARSPAWPPSPQSAAPPAASSRARQPFTPPHKPQCVDCVRIVHQMRNSLALVSYKDRKAVAAALKPIPDWRLAMNQFSIVFEERVPLEMP